MGFSEGGEDDSVLPSMEQELYDLVKGSHDEVIRKVSEIDPSQARVGLEMAWQMHAMQDECVSVPVTRETRCFEASDEGIPPHSPGSRNARVLFRALRILSRRGCRPLSLLSRD